MLKPEFTAGPTVPLMLPSLGNSPWETSEGFDAGASPRWLMVPHLGSRTVLLRNGAGLSVRSVNPRVADLTELKAFPTGDRVFKITGESDSATYLEASHPDTRRPLVRLRVDVKVPLENSIRYRFVTDHSGTTTTRNPGILGDLDYVLKQIYRSQANVTFPSRDESVQVDASLRTIVKEREGHDNPRHSKSGWNKLWDAVDTPDEINVFFMPWDGSPAQRPTEALGPDEAPKGTKPGNFIIIDDGMPDQSVMFALPHMIGRALGCKDTSSDRQRHHLMHISRAAGNPTARHLGFIPRDCANVLNPS